MSRSKKLSPRGVMTVGQKLGYLAVFLVFSASAYLLVRPYRDVIFLAITFVLVLRPVYNYLRFQLGWPVWLSVTTTIILSVLLIIIPVSVLLHSLYVEVAGLITGINFHFDSTYIDSFITSVNQVLASIPAVDYSLDKTQVVAAIKAGVQLISRGVFNSALQIGQGAVNIITNAFIFFFVLVAALPIQPHLRRLIENLSPLQPADTQLYLTRANAIIVDTIRGTLVIALVQASLGIAFLAFAGLTNLTLLFFLMLFLSLLPVVGTAFVTIPIGIYFILAGHGLTGVLLILWQLLIMSTIDNLLRPVLVSENSNIPAVFMLLAILGGLSLYGPIGIIYGPLFMVLFLTTIELAQRRQLFN